MKNAEVAIQSCDPSELKEMVFLRQPFFLGIQNGTIRNSRFDRYIQEGKGQHKRRQDLEIETNQNLGFFRQPQITAVYEAAVAVHGCTLKADEDRLRKYVNCVAFQEALLLLHQDILSVDRDIASRLLSGPKLYDTWDDDSDLVVGWQKS